MSDKISFGTHLRRERIEAGMSIEDVALRIETAPPVSARSRAEWIAAVEADQAPIGIYNALVLLAVVGSDSAGLAERIERAGGPAGGETPIAWPASAPAPAPAAAMLAKSSIETRAA